MTDKEKIEYLKKLANETRSYYTLRVNGKTFTISPDTGIGIKHTHVHGERIENYLLEAFEDEH